MRLQVTRAQSLFGWNVYILSNSFLSTINKHPNLSKLATYLRLKHDTCSYPLPNLILETKPFHAKSLFLFNDSLSLTSATTRWRSVSQSAPSNNWTSSTLDLPIYYNTYNLIVGFSIRRCQSITTAAKTVTLQVGIFCLSSLLNMKQFLLNTVPFLPNNPTLLFFHLHTDLTI
jgi:hypothetical protein